VFVASRPPQFAASMATTSLHTIQKRVFEFLGYMYHLHDHLKPRLHTYLDAVGFVSFISFLRVERDVDKCTIIQHTSVAMRVVSFLHTKAQQAGSESYMAATAAHKLWLEGMHTQLGRNLTPKPKERSPQALMLQGKFMDPMELMARVVGVVDAATQALTQWQQQQQLGDGGSDSGDVDVGEDSSSSSSGSSSCHGGAPMQPLQLAGLVQDALLGAMFFGYFPPSRPSCVAQLTGPHHKGPCVHPDCQHKQLCKGNKVFKGLDGEWHLVFSHHKNSRKWGGVEISFQVPSELGPLLDHHTSTGLATLTRAMQNEVEPSPFLFVNPATGQPLRVEDMAQTWAGIVLEGSGCQFGPQRCRSIFVTSMRTSLTGLHPEMAAYMMGNSMREWDKTYDLNFASNQQMAVMGRMSEWRARAVRLHKGNRVLHHVGGVLQQHLKRLRQDDDGGAGPQPAATGSNSSGLGGADG
jgi:hypothetical protein